jgi:hypothetical protein
LQEGEPDAKAKEQAHISEVARQIEAELREDGEGGKLGQDLHLSDSSSDKEDFEEVKF